MKVVCIGSGNVATHLVHAFKACGAELAQIYSKQMDNAVILAEKAGALAIDDLQELDLSADVYLIAVRDDAISAVVPALKQVGGLVIHTSGATDLNVLSGLKNYGVLYPLQTFSKGKPVDFKTIPLCIEAGNIAALETLHGIAVQLSPLVYSVSSAQRKILHLSAVFACNFVNHLYVLSNELLVNNGLSFDLLRPLILETAEKVQTSLPVSVQTGPAIRKDETTIDQHLKLLEGSPQLQEIYQILSTSIKKTH